MPGTIGDDLMIRMGLDSSAVEAGLERTQGQLAGFKRKTEQLSPALRNLGVALSKGLGGSLGGIIRSFMGPVAGGIGAVMMLRRAVGSYMADVAAVAKATGAFNEEAEKQRKEQAQRQRVTKQDIELYKKHREAATSFSIAMQDVSAGLIRTVAPAFTWLFGKVNLISNWIRNNQGDIVRFLQIVAAVITAALIPSLLKLIPVLGRMALALMTNPIFLMIAALMALGAVIDDFVVWLEGGEAALGRFWSMFGSPAEVKAKLAGLIAFFENVLGRAWAAIKALADRVVNSPAFALLKNILITVTEAGIAAFQKLFSLIAALIEGTSGQFGALGDFVAGVFTAIGGAAEAVIGAIGVLISGFVALFTGDTQLLFEAWQTLCTGLGALWQGFADAWGATWGTIKAVFGAALDYVSGLWVSFCETIRGWLNQLLDWFAALGQKIAAAFSFDGIKEKLKNLLPGWAVSLLGGDTESGGGGGASLNPAAAGQDNGGMIGGMIAAGRAAFEKGAQLYDRLSAGMGAAKTAAGVAVSKSQTVNTTNNKQVTNHNNQTITINAATPEAADRGVTAATRELGRLGTVETAAQGVNL